MTEKPYTPTEHERESAEAREALWQALGKPDKLYEIASALTAAEERGRLVGDAEWLAAIRKRDANCNGPSWLTTSKREHGCNGCAPLRALLDRALAPRDSGTSCGADEDGLHREARKDRK